VQGKGGQKQTRRFHQAHGKIPIKLIEGLHACTNTSNVAQTTDACNFLKKLVFPISHLVLPINKLM
jgi:hypothetical protein